MEDRDAGTPSYTGLRQCVGVGFSLLHPLAWRRFAWTDGRRGIVLRPAPGTGGSDDDATAVMVEVQDLPDSIKPNDLALLSEELASLIGDLPNAQIEELNSFATGTVVGVGVKYTFTEDTATRRRWVRVLVRGSRQVIVTAQGASPEAYAYWEPQFFTAMMTVRVHGGNDPPDPVEVIHGRG